jgi:hypothetical protein
MPSKYQPSGVGYNGQTGAQATWNEATGTWTDANGVSIRDDAIVGTPPSGGASAAAAPATPPAGGGADSGAQSQSPTPAPAAAAAPAMQGLMSTMPAPSAPGAGWANTSPASTLRADLGNRILADAIQGLLDARRLY